MKLAILKERQGGESRVAASRSVGLTHLTSIVTDCRPYADGVFVTCANGDVINADIVVLATGNAAPAQPRFVTDDIRAHERFVADPWAPGALGKIGAGTRAAVKDQQIKLGLPANSYPDLALLQKLGG